MGTGVRCVTRTGTAASIALGRNRNHENENHAIRWAGVGPKRQTGIQEIRRTLMLKCESINLIMYVC